MICEIILYGTMLYLTRQFVTECRVIARYICWMFFLARGGSLYAMCYDEARITSCNIGSRKVGPDYCQDLFCYRLV